MLLRPDPGRTATSAGDLQSRAPARESIHERMPAWVDALCWHGSPILIFQGACHERQHICLWLSHKMSALAVGGSDHRTVHAGARIHLAVARARRGHHHDHAEPVHMSAHQTTVLLHQSVGVLILLFGLLFIA